MFKKILILDLFWLFYQIFQNLKIFLICLKNNSSKILKNQFQTRRKNASIYHFLSAELSLSFLPESDWLERCHRILDSTHCLVCKFLFSICTRFLNLWKILPMGRLSWLFSELFWRTVFAWEARPSFVQRLTRIWDLAEVGCGKVELDLILIQSWKRYERTNLALQIWAWIR